MLITWSDDVDTMVDDEPIVLSEHSQEMCEHTPQPEHPAPPRWLQTLESCAELHTPENYSLSGQDHLGHVMLQKPRPPVPSLLHGDPAGNTSVVHLDQQLLGESTGGDCPYNISRADEHRPEVRLDWSVGEE